MVGGPRVNKTKTVGKLIVELLYASLFFFYSSDKIYIGVSLF